MALSLILGIVVGVVMGITGALQRFTSLSMQGIVPTSLLVIALVGTGGAISALLHGLRPPLTVTALFAAAAIGGTLIGRQFAQRLSNVQIQRGFATLLILVALGLLARTAMAG